MVLDVVAEEEEVEVVGSMGTHTALDGVRGAEDAEGDTDLPSHIQEGVRGVVATLVVVVVAADLAGEDCVDVRAQSY